MHTRLFFGMSPAYLFTNHVPPSSHWARQSEVKGLWGMRLMLLVWRLLGRTAFSALLYPVGASTGSLPPRARKASQDWLAPCTTASTTGGKTQQLSALSTFR